MKLTRVCLLGGTGFVGRHLAARLSARGLHLRIPTRHPQRHRDLLLLAGTQMVAADVHDQEALERLFDGCEAVVNLVGILNEQGRDGRGFVHAHVDLAKKVINACQRKGVRRLLHMSALRAENTPDTSHYLRTKAEAESLVHTLSGPALAVTSLRPSVIFGPGGDFLSRFAELIEAIPGVFPLACAEARFQPVFVGDVADAFADALADPETYGARIDLCGPRSYTLRALVEYVARLRGLRRQVVALPDWIARAEARILERMPGKAFTMDNYLSLRVDSVCADGAKHCPTTLEEIAPRYLGDQQPQRQFDRLRDLGQY
ncbi:epimerase [Acidihalobacter aeolianus]|uniref:Epimerase n=1 Tax=Acidihalobacter aeolianus TaxID=2792603 RepID=A0A1D8K5A8_9GAMM|nr:complex I NDUFA9 subunit family protein [Acidihalobacter aeolianus]AOV16141.1 epimerase [Acidihalobacter aeolianus]